MLFSLSGCNGITERCKCTLAFKILSGMRKNSSRKLSMFASNAARCTFKKSRPIYLPLWQVCSTARYLTCALRHNLHYVFVLPEEDINWKVWPPHDLGYLRVNVWIITLAPTPRSSAQIDKRWPNSRITRTTFAIFTITTEMRVSDNKFFCESSEMHSWQKKLARVQSSEGA